ncbi:MAG: PPOX class F420-dependent oxidoreductase [Actinomycetota bacterium]|nr:PPOX class F420-dependent oxidoreductase [Actinomycetota bacterium]
MELDQAREFLRANHRAVLATLKRDGSPQLSPVTVSVDAAGFATMSTRATAYKVRNLERDPRAWLCLLNDGFFGEWVQLEAEAEIVGLPEAMEGLVDYYRSVSGEHPDWDDYRQAMERDQRVLVRLRLTRAGPDRMG